MKWLLEVFMLVIILIALLFSGFIAGWAVAHSHRQDTKPVTTPRVYQVSVKEDAVLRFLKRLFGHRAPVSSPIPRTKSRVAYDLTADAIDAIEQHNLKGNDATVLRAVAVIGPATAAQLEVETGLGKKSVESSVYRLRRKGLIQSEGRET